MDILDNIRPEARQDIIELEQKIARFKKGEIEEDKFKLYRLTRGVYGQRQSGVQMIRIKLPYGHLTSAQLTKIADVSDTYSTGNLHLTTRQDIQLHYVKMEDSPQLWAELEKVEVTLREACGNTVRNVTASPDAGIHPDEPFDVSPYAQAFTDYFLRNPICQDMGRKIKVAFASDHRDTAFTYFHDIGFIPLLRESSSGTIKGFKVVIGGGLGAQAMVAQTAYEFLAEDELLPFSEALLRVFDRYGERANRNKARLKFLIKKIGLNTIMELVESERKGLARQKIAIDNSQQEITLPQEHAIPYVTIKDKDAFVSWQKTNVFEQKQAGFFGVWIRVSLGDIASHTARKLAQLVKKYAADDIRVTANQGLLIKYVRPQLLPYLYAQLEKLGLSKAGFGSTHDITSCPGSDTCNLAVTNSTALTSQLEKLLHDEFHELISEQHIKIKISGCMNACGQHMAAHIGFHGSSIKNGTLVIPAMQVVIGGGVDLSGQGFIAEKIIKLPTKRIPQALAMLLQHYRTHQLPKELFNDFYYRLGKMHFYQLLKPLAQLESLRQEDYQDWGKTEDFVPEIGVGECASVMLDVIGTIIDESQERLHWAFKSIEEGAFADAVYNTYSSFIIGAKALLLSEDIKCNSQVKILEQFEDHFGHHTLFQYDAGFKEFVLQMKKQAPEQNFSLSYFNDAQAFLERVVLHRKSQLKEGTDDKLVVSDFYKA